MATVECGEHGKQPMTYVCRHILLRDRPRGFSWTANPDGSEPFAWCAECEEKRAEEGRWGESATAFAGIKIICFNCFDQAGQFHYVTES